MRTQVHKSTDFILKVALPVPLDREFDYLPPMDTAPQSIQAGQRVEVPFGKLKKIGIVLAVAPTSDLPAEKLRHAIRVLDKSPLLSPKDLELLRWSSRYYHHPIGDVAFTALSTALRQGKSLSDLVERRLVLKTDADHIQPALPRRAIRQIALLEALQSIQDGVSEEQLRKDNLGSTARILIEKGFAEWICCQASTPGIKNGESLETPPTLNPDQQAAVAALESLPGKFSVTLLFGITGSGKTEVYLRWVENVLAQDLQALVLLPEINLTPQLEARFRQRLATEIRVMHSNLTELERHEAWTAFQQGLCRVLLGTRSALFTPAKALGAIILDEEHDSSYKQQEGFRFSARETAIMRGQLENIPVLLGSATPSMETLQNVLSGKFKRLDLPSRAGEAHPPRFHILDIRAKHLDGGLSPILIEAVKDTLARKEQVLIFVNRRGFAPVQSCHACGWTATCRHCDTRLVTHQAEKVLRCHHCGFQQKTGPKCPECGSNELLLLGLGTERIEESLSSLFPLARITRIDRDTTRRKGDLETYLEAVHTGETDILVGTQMLAKGHHFPDVTLVGIIDVDAGLFSSDFRASERTAQLILQVAGRAGRAQRPGQVLLQTRHPGHPVFHALIQRGYEDFAGLCLKERESLFLPPYSYQAVIRAEGSRKESVRDFLKALIDPVATPISDGVMILGPVPSPMERRGNRYRWQVLLQAAQRGALHRTLSRMEQAYQQSNKRWNIRWSIDVDPIDLY